MGKAFWVGEWPGTSEAGLGCGSHRWTCQPLQVGKKGPGSGQAVREGARERGKDGRRGKGEEGEEREEGERRGRGGEGGN